VCGGLKTSATLIIKANTFIINNLKRKFLYDQVEERDRIVKLLLYCNEPMALKEILDFVG
jgi:hypothetical protein